MTTKLTLNFRLVKNSQKVQTNSFSIRIKVSHFTSFLGFLDGISDITNTVDIEINEKQVDSTKHDSHHKFADENNHKERQRNKRISKKNLFLITTINHM